MKSVITSICLLIILVILFVIIDRKDFYSSDSASVQEETVTETTVISLEPVEKPTENKPFEVKPVESMPAAVNPAEMKPVTESKSATAAKPVEPNLVVEAKHAPAAIPVVSAEEAEKLNAEAIEHQKILNRKRDITILEGKVLSISACPDPRDIDYPDCNLTITVSLNDLKHSNIILVVPCIRQSKTIFPHDLETDSLISFKIIDDAALSEQEKSIQISDDNLDFELDYCYVKDVELISSFSKITTYNKKGVGEIVYDTELPLTEKDKRTREAFIQSELKRISGIVSNYSEDDAKEFYKNFLSLTEGIGEDNHPYAELIRDNGLKKIFPVEVNVTPKRFLDSAFIDSSNVIYHNACMISTVNDYFKKRGMLLIVIPYPQHFESFADRFELSEKLSTYNINRYRYMQHLLEMNVEALDLEPVFEKELKSNKYFHLLFEKNLHPTEVGAYYLAQNLYRHLSSYDFFENLQKNDYSAQIENTIYRAKYYEEEIDGLESVAIRNASSSLINKDSPFLLIGDSFSMSSRIQMYLANALKTRINVINATSSFTNTPRMIQMREQEISANTKVVFLVNSSFNLSSGIKPFINDDIVIYPNEAILPNKDLSAIGKNSEEKISIEFDLDISYLIINGNKYKLVFYVSSTSNQIYNLKINSSPTKQIGSGRTGHGIIDYSLSETTAPLHIELSSTPFEGDSLKNGQNLTLTIDKIILVEE